MSERSIAIRLGRRNYASALTAEIYLLCAPSHCTQIRVFKRGCGREGQHLSFLQTYVKHYTYCQILEGSCFLVKFPSKLIQPIRSSVGGWGATNVTDSGEPLSDPQLGSNNTAYPRPRHYHNTAGLLLTIQMEGREDILIIEANESHKFGDRSWRRHLLKANIWSRFPSKNQGCPKHSQTWLQINNMQITHPPPRSNDGGQHISKRDVLVSVWFKSLKKLLFWKYSVNNHLKQSGLLPPATLFLCGLLKTEECERTDICSIDTLVIRRQIKAWIQL